ncbi:prepilin-type N-terminal cleavage/methylation domain-containing protein [Clostridium sp. HBUAS56017]|uniref:type II secretion system protein n=1 Tax=Clostridium sp. HBUAS56017 TaxID=2571128 RepID=UPI001177B061|nr:prepilin-type N-terminal cleavage/methylation domain-containing protein [Clostridium sp. HBUAS56017]
MKKKSRGVTLIELIIVISLTLVIFGAALTFWIINNRSLTKADLQNTLQTEGKDIEEKLLKVGTESKEITSIVKFPEDKEVINEKLGSISLDSDDKFKIKNIVFNSSENISEILLDGRTLKIISSSGEKVLSKNVEELKVKPLNLNQIENKNNKMVRELNGFEISMILILKKGSVTVNNPVSVVVKLRNKDEFVTEAENEGKELSDRLYRSIYRSQGFKEIIGLSGSEDIKDKLLSDLTLGDKDELQVTNVVLKQYDGYNITISKSDKKLEIINGNGDKSTISNNVKEFKIIPIGIEKKDRKTTRFSDLPGFQISVMLSFDQGPNNKTYPVNIIVKFSSP